MDADLRARRKKDPRLVAIVAVLLAAIGIASILGLVRVIKAVADPYDHLHRLHGQVQLPLRKVSIREEGAHGFFGDNNRLDARYESDLPPDQTCDAVVAAFEDAAANRIVVRRPYAKGVAGCGISATIEDEDAEAYFIVGVRGPSEYETTTIVTMTVR